MTAIQHGAGIVVLSDSRVHQQMWWSKFFWFFWYSTGWWFQIFFYVHPYLGKIPILTNIFQRGWNHQLVNVEAPYFCVIFFLLSYLDMSNQFRLYCKVFHTFKVGSYQLNLWDYCIPPIEWNNPSHKFIFGHLQGFLTPHWYPFITSDGAHNVNP